MNKIINLLIWTYVFEWDYFTPFSGNIIKPTDHLAAKVRIYKRVFLKSNFLDFKFSADFLLDMGSNVLESHQVPFDLCHLSPLWLKDLAQSINL